MCPPPPPRWCDERVRNINATRLHTAQAATSERIEKDREEAPNNNFIKFLLDVHKIKHSVLKKSWRKLNVNQRELMPVPTRGVQYLRMMFGSLLFLMVHFYKRLCNIAHCVSFVVIRDFSIVQCRHYNETHDHAPKRAKNIHRIEGKKKITFRHTRFLLRNKWYCTKQKLSLKTFLWRKDFVFFETFFFSPLGLQSRCDFEKSLTRNLRGTVD